MEAELLLRWVSEWLAFGVKWKPCELERRICNAPFRRVVPKVSVLRSLFLTS